MGELKYFNLNNYIEKYNIEYVIETGTYRGNAIEYAIKCGVKYIYSIELIEEYYNYCCEKFKNNKNVFLFNNTSSNGLQEIFNKYNVGHCLFWLDAHLPNYYKNSFSGEYEKNKKLLILLEDEIRIIVENKNVTNDVFIIDDLRIYERGNFQSGNWNEAIITGGINFIFKMLENTHNIQRLYNDQGYVLCTPK